MNLLRWIVPALSLLLVVVVVLWDTDRAVGPGALHPQHGRVRELQGITGCPQCHSLGESQRVDVDGCRKCHVAVGRQMKDRNGLHGALPADQIGNCGDCHREHHGERSRLLDDASFAKAGIADWRKYDHHYVADFPLTGVHDKLVCEKCHNTERSDPEVGGRWLGLDSSCTRCHEDVHKAAYGTHCSDCHGQKHEFRPAERNHHETFKLEGAHLEAPCAECHEVDGPHSVAALERRQQKPRACGVCHENPHVVDSKSERKRFLIQNSGDCARCHGTKSFAGTKITVAEHKRFFELQGVHGKVDCQKCHGQDHGRARWQGDAPRPSACSVCHESPHHGDLVAAAVQLARKGDGSKSVDAAGCTGCHRNEDADFHAGRMTAKEHALTTFPLSQPHGKVQCEKCHAPAPAPFAKRFPGRKSADCRSCHTDTHKGQFDGDPRYAQCTACHAETHFVPTGFDVAAHARTDFPLRGLHEAVACALCHDRVEGKVRQFQLDKKQCADCHKDPHEKLFDKAPLPRLVDGRAGCARCHTEGGFDPEHLQPFDHGLWTGYPLAGAHVRTDCVACHGRTAKPDDKGRRFGRVAGRGCADCHQDKHVGQFVQNGKTDCTRCHQESAFADLRFDHNRDSRFALDDKHARVACDKCHPKVATSIGPVVRYKPLGVECRDCHRPVDGRERTREAGR